MFGPFRNRTVGVAVSRVSRSSRHDTPTLSSVIERYVSLHPSRSSAEFLHSHLKAGHHFRAANGDMRLGDIKQKHTNAFVEYRRAMGVKTSTVRRDINRLSAAVASYLDDDERHTPARQRLHNPFQRIRIPNEGHDKRRRQPVAMEQLSALKATCYIADDDIRWIVAILIDTGARLAEITGLAIEDIVVDGDLPHIYIRPHSWRRLKTPASHRHVPLIGAALWAARRIIETAADGQVHAFPRYNKEQKTIRSSASATIGKWLKYRGVSSELYCLRHSFVDRLRRASCPMDLRATICGWELDTIEIRYGAGFGLEEMHEWMRRIEDDTHLEKWRAVDPVTVCRSLTGHACATKIMNYIEKHGPCTRREMADAGLLEDLDIRRGLSYAWQYKTLARAELVSHPKKARYRLTGKLLPPQRPKSTLPTSDLSW